jgi:hydroxymethylglutaryl-CoA synthase
MVGIVRYGAHIPFYRLPREVMAGAWGPRFIEGERAVANHDEDSLTMAAQAVLHCLQGMDRKTVDGLIFASTTSPYREKQASTLIGTIADLPENLYTADQLSSLRAGTAALKMAVDMVQSGSAQAMVVTAADARRGEPGSDLEQFLGDGAGAFWIGREGVIAGLEGCFCHSEEFLDTWRKENDPFLRREDAAFGQTYGYLRIMKGSVQGILKKYGMKPSDINHFVFSAPDPRAYGRLVRSLNLPAGSYMEDPLLTWVGDTGAAGPILQLIAILEKAKPADRILLCSYGAGVGDGFLFRVTPEVQGIRDRRGIRFGLSRKGILRSYEKFLKFQQTLPNEPLEPFSSWALLWKERKQNLQLYGTRCRRCGTLAYPRRRVCQNCSAKDEYEDAKLSRQGKVYTFAKDYLYPSPNPPTVMVVADLDGGGRFYGQLTDCDPSQVRIGMTVEFTLRRFHQGGGFYNYFWKLRPVETEEGRPV